MSASRTFVARVTCDSPGCVDEWEDAMTAKQIRTTLAKLGWVHVGTKDYCPMHKDQAK